MANYDSFEAGILMEGMTSEQKLQFHREMSEAWRDPKKAARLKTWLGGIGAHHFYLGDRDRGMKYPLFCWTSVPVIMSMFEGNIKKRTEQINSDTAQRIAMRLRGYGVASPQTGPFATPGFNQAPPSFPANQQGQPQAFAQGTNAPPPSAQQYCSNCGKLNGPTTRFCGGCGAAISGAASAMSPAFNPQYAGATKVGMSTGKKVALVGGSLIAALVVISAIHSATPQGRAEAANREQKKITQEAQQVAVQQQEDAQLREHAVSAASVMAAYEQNEISADNQFKGKVIVVRGRVGSIGKNLLNAPYVTLDDDASGIGSVQCFFEKSDEPKLAKLRPGQTLYIKGTVDGKMISVELSDSIILE